MKFYIENEGDRKVQKRLIKYLKRFRKIKNILFGKDLALVDALLKDGFKIPSNFNYNELSSKYEVPENLAR